MKRKPLIKFKKKEKKDDYPYYEDGIQIIRNSKDFNQLLNETFERIDQQTPEDWKKFCEIGKNDF